MAPAIEQPVEADDTAADLADASIPAGDSPPVRAKLGRKSKQKADISAAVPPDPGEGAAAEASPAADGPPPDKEEGDALIAEMAFPVSGEPDSDLARLGDNQDPVTAGDGGPPSPPRDAAAAVTPAPAPPAARWDRASDTVSFDWPAIERTAEQDGPNQAMAKLLVAAHAEGANSRWPL